MFKKWYKMSNETKEKIRNANKISHLWLSWWKHTDESKLKIGKSNSGEKRNDECRKKISEANKWKHLSIEHKRKIGGSHKWKPCTLETKNKIWNSNRWKVRTEEQNKKTSESHKWLTPWNKWKRMSEKQRLSLSWKNNHNWKGGVTTENKKIRHSIEFDLWRISVFSRDNWTCQKCLVKGGYLHPHHILNFAQYPELRFAIDNWITFCREHHKDFHHIYGNKNNTQEQVNEFLHVKDLISKFK